MGVGKQKVGLVELTFEGKKNASISKPNLGGGVTEKPPGLGKFYRFFKYASPNSNTTPSSVVARLVGPLAKLSRPCSIAFWAFDFVGP